MRARSPTGSSPPAPSSTAPLRTTSASAGSIRGGTAATTSSSGEVVGRSLKECTATSITPSSKAFSISRTNTPCGPMAAKVGAAERSPAVEMVTSSVSWPAASSRAATLAAWVCASREPRVPMRNFTGGKPPRGPGKGGAARGSARSGGRGGLGRLGGGRRTLGGETRQAVVAEALDRREIAVGESIPAA